MDGRGVLYSDPKFRRGTPLTVRQSMKRIHPSSPPFPFLLLLLCCAAALPLGGCVSTGMGAGYVNVTAEEMAAIDRDALRQLQFFTSGSLRLTTGEQALDDSISTEAGRLMKIQTRQQRLIDIPARTPGVVVEMGSDWLDLDVGDGVVLRFRESSDGAYQLSAFNGQPVAFELQGDPVPVEYQGERYEVATNRPVYLQFYVRRVVNVDRASQTIGGKRLEGNERRDSY